MKDIVTYEGDAGLVAILRALDDLRRRLQEAELAPQQAAGYLGCINLHLGELVGASGQFLEHLEECAGLLCPECRGYVGFVSDLSGCCHHCGERFFPGEGDRPHPERRQGRDPRSIHLAHQGVLVDREPQTE